MDPFSSRAAALQRGVRADEATTLEHRADEYTDAQVRQAIVHARQDIVMLVSLLTDLNLQVRTLKWAGLGILGLLVLQYFGRL
jgi:hypothetical protein